MADNATLGGGNIEITATDKTAPGIAQAKSHVVEGVKSAESAAAHEGARAAIEAVRGLKDIGDLTEGQIGPRSIGFISSLTGALGPLGLAFSVVGAAVAGFVGWIARSNEKTEEARRSINRLTRDIEEFKTAEDPKDEYSKRFDAIGKEVDAKKDAIEADKTLNKKQKDEQLKALDEARRYRESQIIPLINKETTLRQEANAKREANERAARNRAADADSEAADRAVRDAVAADHKQLADKDSYLEQVLAKTEAAENEIADLQAKKHADSNDPIEQKENAALDRQIEAAKLRYRTEIALEEQADAERQRKAAERGAKEGKVYADAFAKAAQQRFDSVRLQINQNNGLDELVNYAADIREVLETIRKNDQQQYVTTDHSFP